jgi:O-succinylbenzoic acid--CoA ligase
VRELVALDVEQGPRLVAALREVWARGDAVCVLDPRLPRSASQRALETLAPTRLLDDAGDEIGLPGGAPVEEGDALVVLTSGSTASPRAVVLTHDAVAASARATSRRLEVDPGRDTWLCCLPCAHVGGLAVVTRSLWSGTPLLVHPHFDPDAVARAAAEGATLVSLVPAALLRLGDPRAFRRILLGGAAPPEEDPANVVVTWGMTETGSGVVYDGRPLEGVEVATRDAELLVRGPMLARCYRDGTDLRTKAPDGTDGWFATGDGGEVLDGRVVVRGRLADVINTGGEKVWPADVERLLSTHPRVQDVAVWKRADPRWGERVVAWVVADGVPPSREELAAYLADALPTWAAPKELVVLEALPRLPSGKVDRRALGSLGDDAT